MNKYLFFLIGLTIFFFIGSWYGYQQLITPLNVYSDTINSDTPYSPEFNMTVKYSAENIFKSEYSDENQNLQNNITCKGSLNSNLSYGEISGELSQNDISTTTERTVNENIENQTISISYQELNDLQVCNQISEDMKRKFVGKKPVNGQQAFCYDIIFTQDDVDNTTSTFLNISLSNLDLGDLQPYFQDPDAVEFGTLNYELCIYPDTSKIAQEKFSITFISVKSEEVGTVYIDNPTITVIYGK